MSLPATAVDLELQVHDCLSGSPPTLPIAFCEVLMHRHTSEGKLFHLHESGPSTHSAGNSSTQEISLLPLCYLPTH